MKKKILFCAYSLELGGIEKALINILNSLDHNKYDITLILEKKIGIFLNQIPSNVKVIEYKVSNNKLTIFRKIKNRTKLLLWKFKLHDKYDFACSFATYSIPCSHLARSASKNSNIWMHANYYVEYGYDNTKLKKFLDGLFVKKFKRIVFVSNEAKNVITKHYDGISSKSFVCNNIIAADSIIQESKEEVKIKLSNNPIFVNVSRHEEHQKRLTRIIEASKKLVEEKYKFQILFVGDGPDNKKYKEMVKKYKLEKNILFIGKTSNPYPYFRLSDVVILSSEYEGYPVVFLEAMVMNKPILSTRVSDYEDLEGKNGIFCEKTVDGVYKCMKQYLDNGFKIKKKFNYNYFNQKILNKITDMIENNI